MGKAESVNPDNTRFEPQPFDSLSADDKLRVNGHCDRLEAAWNSDSHPRLEEFMESVPPAERAMAFSELILVDVAHRQRMRLPRSADHYRALFPQLDATWLTHLVSSETAGKRVAADSHSTKDSGFPEAPEDYEIVGRLGEGGMGQVFRAVHKIMKRPVAIKVMHRQYASDPESRKRFEREVQAISRLSHPNIVTAHDARERNGILYLVTELVTGEDLAHMVKRKGPLRPRDAMFYSLHAARGLKYAHQCGIIHRDIKPGNLLVENRKTVKVLDLGLARLLGDDHPDNASNSLLTHSGSVLGTATYMAPEQARDPLRADERSDIYSLGCTLFFLLTGAPPYQCNSAVDTIIAHCERPVPALPDAVNGRKSPVALARLVRNMMAKTPDDRPASMDELIPVLEALIREESASPMATGTGKDGQMKLSPQPGGERSRPPFLPARLRELPVAWVAAVSVLILAAGSWGVWTWFGVLNVSRDSGNATIAEPATANGNAAGISAPGLDFNGLSAYMEFPDFGLEIVEPFMIEVAAIPRSQNHPANLVTWTGPRLAALFINSDSRWGIAWFDGQRSRLVLTVEPARLDELQIVTARWTGQQLEMWVNGQAASVESTDFELQPARPGLFVGGLAAELLHVDEGHRFFDGVISCARVAAGDPQLFEPASSISEMRTGQAANILQLDLSEGSGFRVVDQSPNAWRGVIVDARWRD